MTLSPGIGHNGGPQLTREEAEAQLAEIMVEFEDDPYGFVLWAFTWGEGDLANEEGPDVWQAKELQHIGDGLHDDPYEAIRRAIASGHGIGKTTLIAWVIIWALMTFVDCRGVVTANTDTQLRTKTWPEVTKWYGYLNPLLKQLFACQATSLHSTLPDHHKNWRIDAVPWSKTNPAAFAGLHNAGKRVLVVFDEGSEIADVIYDTMEGATTDADTQVIWLVYGNPTVNTGRFAELFKGKFRNLWSHQQIDSRTVKRTNKKVLDQWRILWGEDSDFYRVRVRGMFPRAGSIQFIPGDLVTAARQREATHIPSDPLVAGLDIARFGDDKSVLRPRRGRDAKTMPKVVWRGIDLMTLAGEVYQWCLTYRPDALFVDVSGLGVGVYDRLVQLGILRICACIPVNFGGAGGMVEFNGVPNVRTANKRAQMWATMRGWLAFGAIEDENDLENDLTGVSYGFNSDQQIQLEKKEDMKKRGLASPDDGDALALTFAEPVAPRRLVQHDDQGRPSPVTTSNVTKDYDPFADLNR